jgi:hypothetical protein
MAEPDNIILAMLRKLDEKLDRVIDDLRDLKTRMTNVEEKVAKLEVAMWRNSCRNCRCQPAA